MWDIKTEKSSREQQLSHGISPQVLYLKKDTLKQKQNSHRNFGNPVTYGKGTLEQTT